MDLHVSRSSAFHAVLLSGLLLLAGAPLAAHRAAAASPPPSPYRVVGYYGDWDKYAGHNAPISTIQFNHITTLIYAFADETDDACKLTDIANDQAKDFPAITQAKAQYPGLQVLLSIGGWSYRGGFADAVSTPISRTTLIANCMNLMKANPGVFDGFDIDWEYPSNATDRTNFTAFIQAFRAALGPAAPLTIAVTANPTTMQWIDWSGSGVTPYLSWINLLSYDYHGPWDPTTDFLAPLYGDPGDPLYKDGFWTANSVDTLLNTYQVPASKVLLGIPFYGRGYANVGPANHGLYQTFTGATSFGTNSQVGGEAGSFDYSDLVANYENKNGYTKYGPDQYAKEVWLYNPHANNTDNGVFISYDDPGTIAAKSAYIKSKGLGGAFAWDLGYDTSDPATSLTTALYNDLVSNQSPPGTATPELDSGALLSTGLAAILAVGLYRRRARRAARAKIA